MIPAFPVLRQMMAQQGISAFKLAAIIDRNIFNCVLKLWGIKRWTLADGLKICCFFNQPDIEQVFVRNNNKQQFLESQDTISKK